MIKRILTDGLKWWNQFFFSPVDHLYLGIFRFLVGLNLVGMYSFRLADWRFFFTNEGYVPTDRALDIVHEFYRPLLTWYPATAESAFVLHVVLLLSALLLMIGLGGRVMAALTLFLHLAFIQRNYSIVYGADNVSTFLLFALIFMDNNRSFSLKAWLKTAKSKVHPLNGLFSSVGMRLVQVQLCIIYGYTGLEKLRGQSWWDGTAVWTVLGNDQLMMFDASWMRNLPLAIGIMTFSTLAFEIYFPVLVWLRVTRKWVLSFGAIFHAMIGLMMGLIFFAGAMLSGYLLFCDINWIRVKLSRWLPERLLVN